MSKDVMELYIFFLVYYPTRFIARFIHCRDPAKIHAGEWTASTAHRSGKIEESIGEMARKCIP
jgi:hypothetical protein